MKLSVCMIFAATFCYCYCARVLFLPAHLGASHKKSMRPFAEALGKRGHTVHFWTIVHQQEPMKSQHFTDDALILRNTTSSVKQTTASSFWTRGRGVFAPLTRIFPWMISFPPCKQALEHHQQAFVDLCSQPWDLIIFDTLFTPCAYMVMQACGNTSSLAASMSTSILVESTQLARGIPTGMQYNPSGMTGVSPKWGFWGNLERTMDYIQIQGLHKIIELAQWYQFGPPYDLFTFDSLEGDKAALAIAVFPPALDWPSPRLPDVVIIGGEDCAQLASDSKLTEPFASFVEDTASKGTIVAAFGHAIQWGSAPDYVINAFFETFANLTDYRVVWQYAKGRKLPQLGHVMYVDWLPQPALLKHPKTIAFVSHMGGKSTLEALCANVPVLAIPLYAEQARNAVTVIKRAGTGIILDKFKLTGSQMKDSLLDLAHNQSMYRRNAQKWTQYIAESEPLPMLDVGAFWVEFIIRHARSVYLLYSRGRWLNSCAYFCLDCLALPGAFIILSGIMTAS